MGGGELCGIQYRGEPLLTRDLDSRSVRLEMVLISVCVVFN